jgi:beta-phosphoglucomutase
MVKGCLFDLDGVIVDTAKYHYIAWRDLAKKLGFEFTEKDNERLKGVSRMASLEILLEVGGIKGLCDDEKQRLAAEKNDNYVALISKMTPDEVLPGAADFLKQLRTAGIGVALGSASKNAMTILNRLQLTPLFDAIIDGTKVSKAKPDPEVFLKGAEALGLQPSECVVFEDAAAGIEAAIAGGMRCVGIGSPEILGKANLVVNGLYEMNISKLTMDN